MITWYLAYPHSDYETVIADIEKYLSTPVKYIVSFETAGKDKNGNQIHLRTNGQHYHILANMEEKEYEKYRKTILTNKYKLNGKANGISREYGKVKAIRNLKLMEAYILKEGNFISIGYTNEEIKQLMDLSYKKEDKEKEKDDCVTNLLKNDLITNTLRKEHPDYHSIVGKAILEYYLEKTDKLPQKRTIQYIIQLLLRHMIRESKDYNEREQLINNLYSFIMF